MATLNNKKNTSSIVHVLATLFGIGSWIVMNGVIIEVPVLVDKLPEGWNLPSYITIVEQIANIGPIMYGILNRFFPRYVHETLAIFVIMSVGTVSCLLLVFTWDITAVIGGNYHSVALIILVFFLSIVDNTSSVVFYPFIGFFKEKYIISVSVGDGLGGFLPGVVSLVQGVGRRSICENVTTGNGSGYMNMMVTSSPLFGVELFFGFLCLMMGISFAAFVLLRFLPSIESERRLVSTYNDDGNAEIGSSSNNNIIYGTSCSDNMNDKETEKITKPFTTSTFIYLLTMNSWTSFLSFGVLPSISSYSCLPYGNLPYQLAVSLATVMCPLASLSVFYFRIRKTSVLTISVIIESFLALYLIILAIFSPNPPFVGTFFGQALVIVASIVFFGINSFVKTALATMFRTEGVRALFWFGATGQLGSILGAVIMFIVVNVYKAFKSNNSCQ